MRPLTGAGTLVRLALRRDRIRLPLWALAVAGLVGSTASTINSEYGTLAARLEYAETVAGNPATAVFSGPGHGATTVGGIMVAELGTLLMLLVVLPGMLLVARHGRAEEESGRAELLGSAILGRHARLGAALTVVCGAELVLGGLVALILAASGLPAAGSLAYGAAVALAGWTFAAIAAMTGQFFQHARTASGAAVAVFGAAYLLRAVGDASAASGGGPSWLSWLSPLGWLQQVRAFAGERWWMLAPQLVTAGLLVALAASVVVRRDVDAGLLRPRRGRAAAAPAPAGPVALAGRLQRGALLAWTAGAAVVAGVFGAVAHDVDDIVGSSDGAADSIIRLGGSGSLSDAYLAWLMTIIGILASVHAVGAVQRLRSEEAALRTEPVLAAAVTRRGWMTAHLFWAFAGAVVVLATAGLVVGLVHGARGGDVAGELPRGLAAGLVQVPAALIPASVAAAFYGYAPRFTAGAWGVVGGALVLNQLGGLLDLDRWVLDLSPFTHTPSLPGGDFSVLPLAVLGGLAAILAAAGAARFRARDLVFD
ncbi:exporter of polyketide antibiotics [Actinomadura cremea]|nr:exporter of polyketide antibiotics [Actinomadura cremea]